MSRGSQTTETFRHRPIVNKASQVKPQQMEVGITALSEMKSVACVPDEPIYFTDKSSQFPDPDVHPEEEETFFDAEDWGDLVNNNKTDPDWKPNDGDNADVDDEEEEQICHETLEEEADTMKKAKYIAYGRS
ncbi:hypothetical protein CHS0354_016406 [Potamilus streckersoni]|uniref:Uncharacterized protein n=1 Tax=Potamilus streckersoni TaxID=2493646 RepID=A0AAE0W2Y2_9BIVA|nr:hypothetical protein CHS0354_016406 [Potamilus streckersoni]